MCNTCGQLEERSKTTGKVTCFDCKIKQRKVINEKQRLTRKNNRCKVINRLSCLLK